MYVHQAFAGLLKKIFDGRVQKSCIKNSFCLFNVFKQAVYKGSFFWNIYVDKYYKKYYYYKIAIICI